MVIFDSICCFCMCHNSGCLMIILNFFLGIGCPLPSTPEDNQLLEAEVSSFNFHPVNRYKLADAIIVKSLHKCACAAPN